MGAVIHNFPKEDVKELLFSIHKWLKKDGKILIYTTIHNKSEEGYYEKEDYSGKIVRFRKKFTENELKELLEEFKFKIVFKMYTEEPDRNKKWLTYIVEKVE
jgi:cyclopropane fatty-acyl-phospholipid synthase-like methyltransferase